MLRAPLAQPLARRRECIKMMSPSFLGAAIVFVLLGAFVRWQWPVLFAGTRRRDYLTHCLLQRSKEFHAIGESRRKARLDVSLIRVAQVDISDSLQAVAKAHMGSLLSLFFPAKIHNPSLLLTEDEALFAFRVKKPMETWGSLLYLGAMDKQELLHRLFSSTDSDVGVLRLPENVWRVSPQHAGNTLKMRDARLVSVNREVYALGAERVDCWQSRLAPVSANMRIDTARGGTVHTPGTCAKNLAPVLENHSDQLQLADMMSGEIARVTTHGDFLSSSAIRHLYQASGKRGCLKPGNWRGSTPIVPVDSKTFLTVVHARFRCGEGDADLCYIHTMLLLERNDDDEFECVDALPFDLLPVEQWELGQFSFAVGLAVVAAADGDVVDADDGSVTTLVSFGVDDQLGAVAAFRVSVKE
ncbi:MAG: hypothetical protein MHM6MM_004647 [Cercozoa sp. M6MM]